MLRLALLVLVISSIALLVRQMSGGEYSSFGNPLIRLSVKDVAMTAELVNTPKKIFLGLSHRQGLPEGRGMLFLMATRARHPFCMRDMLFPIDIIWIADGKVAGIQHNLSPTRPGGVKPPVPVPQALEVPAGFAERHGLKAGDPVRLQISALVLTILEAQAVVEYYPQCYYLKVKYFIRRFLQTK
jgi:uncharacterized membrane protein (UPF0127 family)